MPEMPMGIGKTCGINFSSKGERKNGQSEQLIDDQLLGLPV
jgi:hypothetical protein